MKILFLLHLFLKGIKTIIFEGVQDITESDVEIIYTDEAPSLLSCAQKCYRRDALVNFDPPLCQCFKHINGSASRSSSSVQTETLSGVFFEVRFYFKTFMNLGCGRN